MISHFSDYLSVAISVAIFICRYIYLSLYLSARTHARTHARKGQQDFLVVFSYFHCKYSRSSLISNLPVIYVGNQYWLADQIELSTFKKQIKHAHARTHARTHAKASRIFLWCFRISTANTRGVL